MSAAEPAILFQFQSLRRILFIFLRRVIPPFALITSKRHHQTILFFGHIRYRNTTIGLPVMRHSSFTISR